MEEATSTQESLEEGKGRATLGVTRYTGEAASTQGSPRKGEEEEGQ